MIRFFIKISYKNEDGNLGGKRHFIDQKEIVLYFAKLKTLFIEIRINIEGESKRRGHKMELMLEVISRVILVSYFFMLLMLASQHIKFRLLPNSNM